MVCTCKRRLYDFKTKAAEDSSEKSHTQPINPWIPPMEFIYVAMSNVVYFVIAGIILRTGYTDLAILLIFVGVTSTYYHLYPSLIAEISDYAISFAVTMIYLTKTYGKIVRRDLFIASVLTFIFGILLLFSDGAGPIDEERRMSMWYICNHSLWHILSAIAVLLLVLSTTLLTTTKAAKIPQK